MSTLDKTYCKACWIRPLLYRTVTALRCWTAWFQTYCYWLKTNSFKMSINETQQGWYPAYRISALLSTKAQNVEHKARGINWKKQSYQPGKYSLIDATALENRKACTVRGAWHAQQPREWCKRFDFMGISFWTRPYCFSGLLLPQNGEVRPSQSGIDVSFAAAVQWKDALEDIFETAHIDGHILVSQEGASHPLILWEHCIHTQTDWSAWQARLGCNSQ